VSQRVDARSLHAVIRKGWWLIALVSLLGAGGGYARALSIPTSYEATMSMRVGQPLEVSALDKESLEASQEIALTYGDLLRRQVILQRVVDALGLETSWHELGRRVQPAIASKDRQILVVTVRAESPGEAKRTATEMSHQLIALSPTSESKSTVESQDFLESRLEALQRDITRMQIRVDRTENALALASANGEAVADLQKRLILGQTRLVSWQRSYSSLLDSLSVDAPSNVLQVLETPRVVTVPSDVPLFTGLGAAFGLLAGFCLAYALAFRGRGKLSLPPVASRQPAAGS
jgi:capsular polysaccharide biosynthesis protein